MRFKCSLYSCLFKKKKKKKRRPNPNTCKQLWLTTKLYLTVYVKFGFFQFVCMYGFNFWTVKILKNVIVLFSKCWPPTVVSCALFLCYSLLNMFVTVAVINVKIAGSLRLCCISPCVDTARSIIHTIWTWVWVRLRPSKWIKPPQFCACVWMWGPCVCACYCLSLMWARLLTIQKVYTKCFECIRYTADCVLRNIGTNAFSLIWSCLFF